MDIPEPLNLDQSRDVETFRNVVMSSARIPQDQKEEILAHVLLLNRYFHINPGIKVFQWRAIPPQEHVYIDSDPTYSEYHVEIGNAKYAFDLYMAWQLGLQISTFSSCEGFDELIKTIQRNPQKIAGAMFEAEIAFICKNHFSGKNFKFNQPYMVKGHPRNPDFEFTGNLGRIIVECKRLHYTDLQQTRRYESLQKALGEKIVQLGLDKTHRVEVILAGSFLGIDTFVTHFEKQVLVSGVSNEFSYKEGENEIWVFKQSTPLHCDASFISRHFMVAASTLLTEIAANSAYIVMVVPEEAYKRLVTKLGDLIKEASDQIPQTHIGIIFIDTPNTNALRDAWDRKDLNLDYQNILALGMYHKQGVTLQHRPTDAGKVRQLLGGASTQ